MLSPERIREIARDCEDASVITSSTNAEDLRALADELEMKAEYVPFNSSGTMCPPSPEMLDEQAALDETNECPHGIGFDEDCERCL